MTNRRLTAALVTLALAVAGCSNDSPETTENVPSSTTQPGAATTTSTTAGPGTTPSTTEPVANDQEAIDAADAALRAADLEPARRSLFSLNFQRGETLYGDPLPPAPDDAPHDEDAERARLVEFMNSRPGLVDRALEIFDDPTYAAILPAPRLRAALAGSVGTIWEPMIDHLADPETDFTGFDYGETRWDGAIATSEGEGFGAGPRTLTVNERLRGERLELLIPSMGHEVLHDDGTGQLAEEIVANVLSAVSHGQLLLRDPSLAYEGTAVSQINNAGLAALLLSRDDEGLRLRVDGGDPLFPGADPRLDDAPDYISVLEKVYGHSNLGVSIVSDALEPRLHEMLTDVVSPGVDVPTGRDIRMTSDLIDFIDENLDLSPAGLDAVAQVQLLTLLQLIDPSVLEDLGREHGVEVEAFLPPAG